MLACSDTCEARRPQGSDGSQTRALRRPAYVRHKLKECRGLEEPVGRERRVEGEDEEEDPPGEDDVDGVVASRAEEAGGVEADLRREASRGARVVVANGRGFFTPRGRTHLGKP